ncbi:hypothetical protein S40293_04271 [Stachybotrys chartarum IBT 40293]|nr:hypothetical protein S40293_04271 [Stachybotrys chartarum IBT 40293]KFA77778.1 hypothetical protein S40288_00502 [Stachybotrys chartarum IBT 40288]
MYRIRPLLRSRLHSQFSAHHLQRTALRNSSQSSQTNRIDRITARLPRRLQKYTQGLRNAPVSHIISFLILHELTAIVPLFGLFGLFHYTDYVPVSYMTQHFGGYVDAGAVRFEKYFRRKGWFGFKEEDGDRSPEAKTVQKDGQEVEDIRQHWQNGEPKYQVLMEVALAYAVTKALLPIRIIWSVWTTPWFARNVLLRFRWLFTRKA